MKPSHMWSVEPGMLQSTYKKFSQVSLCDDNNCQSTKSVCDDKNCKSAKFMCDASELSSYQVYSYVVTEVCNEI